MTTTIDLTPFEKALRQLKRALTRANADLKDEELRDACIQRFEYTYELAWKMLKRQLEIDIANSAEVDNFFEKAVQAGATIVYQPADKTWGDRVCKLKDPDEHIWGFATTLSNGSP